jgi:hypothetical protein
MLQRCDGHWRRPLRVCQLLCCLRVNSLRQAKLNVNVSAASAYESDVTDKQVRS